MKARLRITTIAIALAVVGFVVWQTTSQNSDLLGNDYPGFTNQKDVEIDAPTRAQWETQLKTAQGRLESNPDDLDIIMDISFWQSQLGLYADSRRNIEYVIEKNPINAAAWTMLGDVSNKMGDYDTAESAWTKSLTLAVDGNIFRKIEKLWRAHFPGRYEDIVTLYEDAIALDGQKPNYLSRLVFWYEENEKWDEAMSHQKVLVDMLPDDEYVKEKYEEYRTKARESREN